MSDIKFSKSAVKGLTYAGIIKFTDDRIQDMEDCADFLPNPTPSIVDMTGLRIVFQTKEASFKASGTELAKSERNDAFDVLVGGHLSWIDYAEPLVGSDEVKAARIGYTQYAKRTSAVVPTGKPEKPTFSLTNNPGEIIVRAKPYKQGSKPTFYNWQISEDGGATFSNLPSVNNSHRRLLKLEFGKLYSLRVAYATSAGEGIYSDRLEVSLTSDMVAKLKKAA
jgi:hypothetical protein